MTYDQAEKNKDENSHRVFDLSKEDLEKINLRPEVVIIASNTTETRTKEKIISGISRGKNNKEVLTEIGDINKDLNVFVVGKTNGNLIVITLDYFLELLDRKN